MAISVTIPDLDFVPRGSLERDAYVTHQDTQFGILSGAWGTAMSTLKTQINITEANINTRENNVSYLSLQVSNNASMVSGMTAQVLKAYNDAFTLINSYVIPTEATYNAETIDNKIADGVLIYGLAYGFGRSEVVKGESEILDEAMTQQFKINYLQGY